MLPDYDLGVTLGTTPLTWYNVPLVSHGFEAYVLNGENLFDYHQTRKGAIVLDSRLKPHFPQPRTRGEGRVINLSATVEF